MTSRVDYLEQQLNMLAARLASTEARLAASDQNRWQYAAGPTPAGSSMAASWFITTSTITAGGGGAVGSGTATSIVWNGSTWTSVTTGITVLNGNEKATTASSGIYVWCVPDSSGTYWVTTPSQCADWA